jgi:hypothetical protein
MSTATLIQATKKERPGILQDILLLELTGEEKTMTCHQVKHVYTNFLLYICSMSLLCGQC